MTDNFDEHDHEHDPNHDEFNEPEMGSSDGRRGLGGVAEAWRTRPMFKFMVLIVAVFAVAVAAFSFLGGSSNTDVAHLGRPPNMKEAPGGQVSPYMRQQTELANKERVDQANASGGSAMPTPIGQNSDVGGFGQPEKKDEALNELRAETERLKTQVQQQQVQQQQIQQQQVQQQQQPPKPPEQFDNSLAEAMQHQMTGLLEGWKPKGMTNVEVLKAADVKSEEEKAAKDAAAAQTAANAAAVGSQNSGYQIVVNAGTVNYAQLLTEANSDVPGPILAQIVSGPLSGARAVGEFEVSAGYEKYLVLRFSLADKKGKDYSINAIALDPDTTLGGMATEVDERYFVRVILPAAAGFLQGLGQSLGQGSGSVTTNGDATATTIASNGFHTGVYNGLNVAAGTMGQFFQNQANVTKPLVRVAAGTPMGLFFVRPVFEPNGATDPDQQLANPTGNGVAGLIPGNGGMFGGASGGGYPGTNVAGYGNGGGNGLSYPGAAGGVPYPNYASQSGAGMNSPFGGAAGSGTMPGMNGTLIRGFNGYSTPPSAAGQ